jgi:hypothetical protein
MKSFIKTLISVYYLILFVLIAAPALILIMILSIIPLLLLLVESLYYDWDNSLLKEFLDIYS